MGIDPTTFFRQQHSDNTSDVLRFARPNGWQVVTNFGVELYALDDGGEVVLSSSGTSAGSVAPETTVWIAPARLGSV